MDCVRAASVTGRESRFSCIWFGSDRPVLSYVSTGYRCVVFVEVQACFSSARKCPFDAFPGTLKSAHEYPLLRSCNLQLQSGCSGLSGPAAVGHPGSSGYRDTSRRAASCCSGTAYLRRYKQENEYRQFENLWHSCNPASGNPHKLLERKGLKKFNY